MLGVAPSRQSQAGGGGAVSVDEYNAVLRENARLVALNRRLHELVEAMREEIADANAEIAAGKRLHDEQKAAFLSRLQTERIAVEAAAAQVQALRVKPPMKSVATSTMCEMSTSTASDATTNTATGFAGQHTIAVGTTSDVAAPAIHFASNHYGGGSGVRTPLSTGVGGGANRVVPPSPLATYYDSQPGGASSAQLGGGYPPRPQQSALPYQQQQYPPGGWAGTYSSRTVGAPSTAAAEMRQFADYLSRGSGYVGRDLAALFEQVLGATSVGEVCATVTERDLVDYGVPVAKSRTILHLIMEHATMLLGVP